MGEVSSPRGIPLPYQRLRLLAIVILVVMIGFWARFHFTNQRVNADLNSQAHLTEAAEQAQPVLDALEKYHADNGLYPATLNQLSPAYLPGQKNLPTFRYSARHSDWVFQSAACIDREKSLHGWVLKEAKAYQSEVAQYKRDCVTGYRDFELQSSDFPTDGSRYLERWAYYDSAPQHWSLGWCEHVPSSKGTSQELATNGICRWRSQGAIDPALDQW